MVGRKIVMDGKRHREENGNWKLKRSTYYICPIFDVTFAYYIYMGK